MNFWPPKIREKTPSFGVFFCHHLQKDSNYFDEILQFNSPWYYLTLGKISMSVKNLVRAVHMHGNGIFSVLAVFWAIFALSYIISVVKNWLQWLKIWTECTTFAIFNFLHPEFLALFWCFFAITLKTTFFVQKPFLTKDWDEFDYPGSIVYLSWFLFKNHFWLKIIFLLLR